MVLAAGVMGRAFWAIWYLLGCARSADMARPAGVFVSLACSLRAGRALATAGRRDDAIAQLQQTEAQLAASGAQRFSDEAARELRRLGRRVIRTGRGAGSGELGRTSRELEVARLVTAGKSNREIAAELFLSAKTVESHLSNVFTKLGVTSRAAVAGVWRAACGIDRSRAATPASRPVARASRGSVRDLPDTGGAPRWHQDGGTHCTAAPRPVHAHGAQATCQLRTHALALRPPDRLAAARRRYPSRSMSAPTGLAVGVGAAAALWRYPRAKASAWSRAHRSKVRG